MRIKHLLIYSTLALSTLAGCSPKTSPEVIETPVVVAPVKYNLTEDFESASKKAYAPGEVNAATGKWSFDDAVIGDLPADLKNGTKSVRLRTGNITMKFDVTGLQMLYIKHGKYGNDAKSTWQLMMSIDGGTTFTQVGNNISEDNATLATDSFKVENAGKVRFQIKKEGTARINIDDITFRGIGESGIVMGGPDTNPVDTAGTTNPVPSRPVVIGADAQPAQGDDSNLLLGNPSNASSLTPDNYLLNLSYYVESYSSNRATPNWVSWHLDNKTTTNVSARLDNFAGFSGLPAGFYQVQSSSYKNSGFDRGHNCPSADRTSSVEANGATFLMTNMIPQAPNNNQGPWAKLEEYLRKQVDGGNEVYIIMGSYGTGGMGKSGNVSTTIDNGKITVPANVWKVAVIIPNGNGDLQRITTSTRVLAVNTPNVNSIDTDWKKYIVTVKDIEAATGYTLLSNLPQQVQEVIKLKKDAGN